jgi:YegS/Rv2252/BmrU family lipid kinase
MSAARRLVVLCNPTAGGGRAAKALEAVSGSLRGAGLEVRIERTQSQEHAVALARAAAETGEEVVAFGGDGMVRIAAHAVRETGATLGILPGGRGNDFARALGIPQEPLAACRVLFDGRTRAIDAGDADGATFVGNATIGIESEVTRIANAAPRIGGQAVYLGSTFVGLARWKPATYSLALDGGEARSFTGYMACAANSGRFGGGMRVAPDAKLDDGLFDVVVIEHGPRWKFVLDTPKVFKGTHVSDPRVHVFRASEVRMDADRPFEVYADGDPIASTPSVVRVVPGALQVLAPAS